MSKFHSDARNSYALPPPSFAGWNWVGAANNQVEGWMSFIGHLQNEIANFAQARFCRDIDAMEQFARCRKPEEYVDAQAKFFAEIFSDYAKENLKIAGMLAGASRRARDKVAEVGVRMA